MKRLSSDERALLDALTPFWQRIATGEIDLTQYTDEEIIDVKLRMTDGRLAPMPRSLPRVFREEQARRIQEIAKMEIATGALKAVRVKADIMNNDRAAASDRLRATDFFTNKFFGTDTVNVNVAKKDRIEELFEDLLEDPNGLLGEVAADGGDE